ncbi:MAG TPA: D-cysteine desulfhydrase family protein [Vicinamibacterales bacterium]|nr:D-cysteine desulfhydrase family protein [Vicinamibacterales bacterium]
MASALAALMSMPSMPLAPHATPVDDMTRLARELGPASPRILIKRDDLLSFGCGGNKVRKLQLVLAEARARGADTLITCGGPQSNHARATAAAGAALGMRVLLVLNGTGQTVPTGNARLDRLFGAEIHFVPDRADRGPAMDSLAASVQAQGGRPYVIPLGASTPLGAAGFARGVAEIATTALRPDVIVHASSSAGTQAGLIAGCALLGLQPRIIGVSADEPADTLRTLVRELIEGMASMLGAKQATIGLDRDIEVDDSQVGDGYGVPTASSTEALELVARREGILLDPVYTAKAMAGLVARVRQGEFNEGQTILFWHTGGQVGYFA